MIGSEKMTFSPVFIARSSRRMMSGGNAARDHRLRDDLAFRTFRSRRHPAADDRPAKIAARARACRLPSTRSSTSWRVPNTNSRSAGCNGVSTRCRALIAAISASVGNRSLRSVTAARLVSGNAPPRCRAPRAPAKSRFIALDCEASRQQRVRQAIERVAARPVAPDEAADLPGEQRGEADQKQRAGEFAGRERAHQQVRSSRSQAAPAAQARRHRSSARCRRSARPCCRPRCMRRCSSTMKAR